jgi:hypothetical protein
LLAIGIIFYLVNFPVVLYQVVFIYFFLLELDGDDYMEYVPITNVAPTRFEVLSSKKHIF